MSTLLIIVILLLLFGGGADIMHMATTVGRASAACSGLFSSSCSSFGSSACCAEFCARVKFAFTPADVPGSASGIFPLSRKYHILHPTRRKAIDAEAAFLVFPVMIGPTDRSSSMGVDQLAFSESITIYI